MRLNTVALVILGVLVLAACSGGTPGDSDLEGVDSGPSVTADTTSASDSASDPDSGSTGRKATVVTIGSETYEVDGYAVCLTGEGISTGAVLDFIIANETDSISVKHLNEVVLIKMTIDGEDWADTGSPPSPVVTGSGGDATITWSGEMASSGGTASVSIEAYC